MCKTVDCLPNHKAIRIIIILANNSRILALSRSGGLSNVQLFCGWPKEAISSSHSKLENGLTKVVGLLRSTNPNQWPTQPFLTNECKQEDSVAKASEHKWKHSRFTVTILCYCHFTAAIRGCTYQSLSICFFNIFKPWPTTPSVAGLILNMCTFYIIVGYIAC